MKSTSTRKEKDFIGEMEVPQKALFGIHSLRASNNFPDKTRFHPEWYRALGTIKKICYLTTKSYFEKLASKSKGPIAIKPIQPEILDKLIAAAEEIERGNHFDDFIVPAVSGGAGTSINMNINEIITNRSLILDGRNPGDYFHINPIEHANIFQSTNDVIPSSLKLAILKLLNDLEESINRLRAKTEKSEKKYQNSLRIGYTQMQEAVPTSYGRLFSTYNDALSRDWWRVSKCFERIKVINLGGSAIGSGITVPRYFIMEVVRILQEETKLPLTRGENLYDATSNLDSFVEIHATLKSHAVNLEKMVSDIRLLASDILSKKELSIPNKQVGSSIMPGKINPVIPEFVISSAHKIYSNDQLISSLSAQGCLELNAYIPIIGHALIESIKLLLACNNTINDNLLENLEIDTQCAVDKLFKSPSITTALVPYVGYDKAGELAKYMKINQTDIVSANNQLNVISKEKLEVILKPENLLKEGFTLSDLQDYN